MTDGMNDAMAKAALAKVEDLLKEAFGKDVVLNITADEEIDTYLVKASAANDAELAKGYRELAEIAKARGISDPVIRT